MDRKFHIALSLIVAVSVLTATIPARNAPASEPPFGNAVYKAAITYTEEAAVKVRDPKNPKDTDDSDFTLRINATFQRTVQMSNDGMGVSLADCAEFNPDGGCKTYTPLNYGGSVVYSATHKVHTESVPPELADVYNQNAKGDFSGVILAESDSLASEENFTSVAFDLHVGLKGNCEGSWNHNSTVVEYSGKQEVHVPKSESGGSKKCADVMTHIASEPELVSGVTAEGTDAPQQKEIKFDVVACNTNPEYCAEQKAAAAAQLGDAADMAEASSSVWLGGITTGDIKQGYKFHLEGTRDMSKFRIPPEGTGTWRSALIVDASVTPITKTGTKSGVAALSFGSDLDALLSRRTDLPSRF